MTDQSLVYIIDDNDDLRLSLDSLFRSVGLQTKMFGSASEFIEASKPNVASCLVLDVRLPGVSGLDFQDQLGRGGAPIPIIVMTGHGDIQMSVRAMKAGAIDFLVKPFRDQDMLDAVATALKADRERREGDGDFTSLHKRYLELTEREKQVMALVTSGLMNKQVAGELKLSEVTIKIHRSSAMRKMEARTLADLVRMADLLKNRNALS
ncbi:response regulator transcription factor [Neorhizobium lilium]|uniref:Response regulator transcription factor n=1 Tax=Neorhizobium lilium TaxID=2503024 RepID=A0A3S3SJ64_9HYPH|nr:response regulator [Neorhizobium lilium]RWX81774.1 response regulator transcription factor [Neorhizobium lilium]